MEELFKYHEDISEEIKGARHYAKMAIETKDNHPDYSRRLKDMANQELEHAEQLHKISIGMITDETKPMYEHLHKMDVENMAEVKLLISMA